MGTSPIARRLIGELRTAIGERGDPLRAAQQQRYMKSTIPYRGLSSAELRSVVKPILDQHRLPTPQEWATAIGHLWAEVQFREEWYAALALARHRFYRTWARSVDAIEVYEQMIRRGRWWDVCDELAAHLVGGVLASHPQDLTAMMRLWAVDDEMWIRRCSILAQLRRRDDTDRELLATCIAGSLSDRDFFARKAIGWALREFSKTDPSWVRNYVAVH
ncbi:MAG TPA: DNA alkylation repair protein, partial [Ilumatobacteraceae bacterium]|nr:DNA alkylation repair protein [Ilumatobacteraceae bacterium]